MEKELISIVVPIYNVKKYLRKSLESIINQTYTNIEIILVDDGSTDGCFDICEEYKNKDNRINVIHKKNGGLSEARNFGIDCSRGRYIAFIDSDDYVARDYIEKLYEAIKKYKTKIVQCATLIIDEHENILKKVGYDEEKIVNYDQFVEDMVIDNRFNVVAWNKLYSIELFKEMKFPKGKIHEDEFITYKIVNGLSIGIIPNTLYFYRINNNGINRSKFTERKLDKLEAFYERYLYYKENNEEKLKIITLLDFLDNSKYMYSIVYNEKLKNKMKIKRKILYYYRKICLDVISEKKINFKKKIKSLMFYFVPNIWTSIKNKNIKFNIQKKKYEYKYNKYKRFCNKKNQREFLIFNTPLHGNIGDHAIIYAEEEILKQNNIKPFEIATYESQFVLDYIKENTSKNSIISITGGGFIGSQWMYEQNLVKNVISNFSNHKIIVFPSTIYFKDDLFGNSELKEFKKIVNNAKDITIFARENKTFELIKEEFKSANYFLVPDIVLSLPVRCDSVNRDGVLICLRKDVESKLTENVKETLIKNLKQFNLNIKYTDTVVNYGIKSKNRKEEIEKKLNEFEKAKLVITDRLHGMVFAFLTNTPCIVIGNYNYKVRGVYEWISKKTNKMIFVEKIDDIKNNVKNLLNTDKNDINNAFDIEFKEIKDLERRIKNG